MRWVQDLPTRPCSIGPPHASITTRMQALHCKACDRAQTSTLWLDAAHLHFPQDREHSGLYGYPTPVPEAGASTALKLSMLDMLKAGLTGLILPDRLNDDSQATEIAGHCKLSSAETRGGRDRSAQAAVR